MFGALLLFSAVVAATCNTCSDGACDEISFVQKQILLAEDQAQKRLAEDQAQKRILSKEDELACILLVEVSSTATAGVEYWDKECLRIPEEATMVRLNMGSAVDYFKPKDGYTYCDMLTANDKHTFSADGHNWQVPTYFHDKSLHLGGSAWGWPVHNVAYPEGNRAYLSFWGVTNGNKGGCCSSKYDQSGHWGQAFEMHTCFSSSAAKSDFLCPRAQPTQGSSCFDYDQRCVYYVKEGEEPLTLPTAHCSNGTWHYH